MKNKYSFDCLYLDQSNRNLLEDFCIKNKMVDRFYYGDKLRDYDINLHTQHSLTGIKKLLIYLTLFEKIDSNESIFDFGRLIDIGIVDQKAHIVAPYDLRLEDQEIWKKHDSKYEVAHIIAMEIMELRKKELISKFLREQFHTQLCKDVNGRVLSFDKDYSEIIRYSSYYDNYHPNSLFTYITCEVDNLVRGIYYSINENMTIGTGILQIPNKNNMSKQIDTVYYTVKTQLPQEVNILPMPQSIKDVEKMRQTAELKSFRNVMKDWFNCIDIGDLSLAEKIKKDVIKANKALTRLKKYQQCIRSPYYRIFNLIGAEIPVLSTLLNVLGFVSSFVEDEIQKKNEWILLPKIL